MADMTREQFIKQLATLAAGLPLVSSYLLAACNKTEAFFPEKKGEFNGKVIIIGAGAAGIAAAYALHRYGVDFQIIEAGENFGGRVKKLTGFVDFPIDLGAEWIHTEPDILSQIIDDESVNSEIEIITYNPQTIQVWNNGKLRSHHYVRHLYSEWKFKRDTWFDFLDTYLVPNIAENMLFNKPVVAVDYSSDNVRVSTQDGEVFEADKVLITVPIKVLQSETIDFQPALPENVSKAINDIYVGDGIKIFVEFKRRFYPDFLGFGNIVSSLWAEEKYVYDAAFRKDSERNVLGLFAINEPAAAYTRLANDEAIIKKFLSELDEIFEGKASENYLQHVIQNWTKSPYIQGAYSYSFNDKQKDIVDTLTTPTADKLYFAGEALSIAHQSTVHGACESGFNAVEAILSES